MQTTKNVLLIKPANFGFNTETEASNAFQNKSRKKDTTIQAKAIEEFDAFASTLHDNGINVFVFDDTEEPAKPDAVFPNNWVTFHPDGTVILYPMYAPNRRHERRSEIVYALRAQFNLTNVVNLSQYESENKFLEGTGSMVFDHENKIAYACLSPRTDEQLFLSVCNRLEYQAIHFKAHDSKEKEVYHTNVMMCIGEKFAAVCLKSITDKEERALVKQSLSDTNHEIIEISLEQMNQFAGNMLSLQNNEGQNILVLSQSSFDSLTSKQKKSLTKYAKLLPVNIETIETIGGGSARCMIAEIFLATVESMAE